MVSFLQKIIFSAIIVAFNIICLIMWIIGWPLTDRLKDPNEDDDTRDGDPARFYFVWGLLMYVVTPICLLAAVFIPFALAKKYAAMASVMFSICFLFVMTNVLAATAPGLIYDDCSIFDDDTNPTKNACYGNNLIFATTFITMFYQALQIAFSTLLMADGEEEK
eukprot:TRINITY_DN2723_c0_g1_i1.p1 TRINITY_DN2723_c0_g1~~TRINITY_DN2723_c0_g1_i1.p1  ORF type:complete len:164 (+),score=22.17 TRINITY_DN2723_c0_g1_i1:58-549(+)